MSTHRTPQVQTENEEVQIGKIGAKTMIHMNVKMFIVIIGLIITTGSSIFGILLNRISSVEKKVDVIRTENLPTITSQLDRISGNVEVLVTMGGRGYPATPPADNVYVAPPVNPNTNVNPTTPSAGGTP